jgi:hypothetical protein
MAWWQLIPAIFSAGSALLNNSNGGDGGGPGKEFWQTGLGMINQNTPDVYARPVSDWYNKVMAPGYQAYTPEYLDNLYNQGAAKLKAGVFNQWQNDYGARMANQGISGSGVANIDYGKVLGAEGGALADLYNNVQQYGMDATRQDVAQAAGMYPSLSAMNYQYGNQAWDRYAQMLGAYMQKYGIKAQQNSANAAGIGSIISSIIDAIAGSDS